MVGRRARDLAHLGAGHLPEARARLVGLLLVTDLLDQLAAVARDDRHVGGGVLQREHQLVLWHHSGDMVQSTYLIVYLVI